MASAGANFDQDGNLVVTVILSPADLPSAPPDASLAQEQADAAAAVAAATASETAAEAVSADLTAEAAAAATGAASASVDTPSGDPGAATTLPADQSPVEGQPVSPPAAPTE